MAEINPKPGHINEKTGKREFTAEEADQAIQAAAKTGSDTHRATARGHAQGQLIEEGEVVPAGTPISEEWMEQVKKGVHALSGAIQEAQADHPGDVDLTKASKSALEAMALERGINVQGLSKDDLIVAIKAEREPTI
jgi:hypothetical protein